MASRTSQRRDTTPTDPKTDPTTEPTTADTDTDTDAKAALAGPGTPARGGEDRRLAQAAGQTVADDHVHPGAQGPANLPAGAHRHTPEGGEHHHPTGIPNLEHSGLDPDAVKPAEAGSAAPPEPEEVEEGDDAITVRARHDFRANVDGQLLDVVKDQELTGPAARALLKGGAPVDEV